MAYILFLIIATWAATFYLYCRFKELNDKMNFYDSRIANYEIDSINCICRFKNIDIFSCLDRLNTQLEVHESRLDGQHSVISESLFQGNEHLKKIDELLNKHENKILTLTKKNKKEKIVKKETKVKKEKIKPKA